VTNSYSVADYVIVIMLKWAKSWLEYNKYKPKILRGPYRLCC